MFLQKIPTSFLKPSRSLLKLSYSPVFYNSTDAPKKSFYKILNVATDASADDIKKSYLDLAKKYHPDTAPGDTELADKFKDISEAYRTLSNVKKRQQYDIENGIITQQQASYTEVDPEFKNEDVYSDWADKRSRSKKGADVLEDVEKFFNEKYFGGRINENNLGQNFRAFSDIENKIEPGKKGGSVAFKVLYDFRYALAIGFGLFTVGSVGEIIYRKNKEKRKISSMTTIKEGKGILTTLTPLNPV